MSNEETADSPETAAIVWHRRHLRVDDQPAVTYATENYDTVVPLFIFDPAFYEDDSLVCNARRKFLHECLKDLSRQYTEQGTTLLFRHGDAVSTIRDFAREGWSIITTATPTGRYGARRDRILSTGVGVQFIDDDGLKRDVADPRDGWSAFVENYFESSVTTPDESGFGTHDKRQTIRIQEIEEKYDVESTKEDVPTGGRKAAMNRLDRFMDTINEYPASISSPAAAETGTSRLSAHLRFGCLSVREFYKAAQNHTGDGRAVNMLTSRLYWNRHYNQKLEDWAGWMDTAVNPVFRGLNRSRKDDELIAAWKQGKTGFPMVDASMRCLKETGWLNFRMRAMCASFFGYILQQPWKIGADWFYYHLIDADPAINYTQWQNQTGVVGVNTLRIYNPRKQVRDNDPDGEFIKKWVPELRDVPVEHLDQPEKMPVHIQNECGVDIGETYPYPVVDYEATRKESGERFSALQDRAHEALRDPEVYRRASLSRRGGRIDDEDPTEDDTEETAAGQTGLGDF